MHVKIGYLGYVCNGLRVVCLLLRNLVLWWQYGNDWLIELSVANVFSAINIH